MDDSSEESVALFGACPGDVNGPPAATCIRAEVEDVKSELQPAGSLSPSLLAELSLSYTPMRVTRRMASAFSKSLGISVEQPVKPAPVAVKKTGKRSAGRGARSGWSKSPIIEQVEQVVMKERKGKQVKEKVKQKGGKGKFDGGAKKKGSRGVCAKIVQQGTETGEDVSSGVTEGGTTEKVEAPPKIKFSGVGWVMCDDCRKWRCISSELADSIESSDVKWTCKDNPNRKYSDCSVPQEKTNAEINAELNISEISTSEGDDIDAAVNSKSRASWTQIRHNIFHHRQPKKLDDDDALICQCKPPPEGLGCGDDCLNRMVNVECTPDTCPCGERCSNQQFVKRMYAKFALVRCGRKGFGLRALEHISKGSFIIEYVGEVLDIHAFEMRQKEYTRQRQKHFYFMTLNSSEVIDACRKGNLGRFINHSCEPNAQTEKWCVNGEICIGLFAIRDVKQNEEITFNYNFERLYGAAAKRCHCGSAHCHGYIGGDPTNPRDVVQTDSEEDAEPIMLKQYESDDEYVDTETPQEVQVCTSPEAVAWEPEPEPEPEPEAEPEPEPEPEREPEPAPVILKPKPVVATKTCRVKRVKSATRPKKLFSKAFKPMAYRGSEVEEKLDKLLNDQGGLMKKKDTPKQYLKLLVISTASGDASSEGTSCSIRDLSLLLDAMLKTASRTILIEVIQKNGLQLLHNLVKQSRKSWTKIPILRKLLKVLELLAERKVIKSEQMTSTPPRNGMESFVKSIFELTRHDDMEVQQISRRFQKNWLPDMFDLLANDRSSGNQFVHKHWGPDRFSQKRELFRSKPEEKPRRHADEQDRKIDEESRHCEQDSKRRKKGSRWDELPTQDSMPPPSSSSQQLNSREPRKDESSTPSSAVEQCEAEPPGYSSSSACFRTDRHSAPLESQRPTYHHNPPQQQQQQQQQQMDYCTPAAAPAPRDYRDGVSREYRDATPRDYRDGAPREYRDAPRDYRDQAPRDQAPRDYRDPASAPASREQWDRAHLRPPYRPEQNVSGYYMGRQSGSYYQQQTYHQQQQHYQQQQIPPPRSHYNSYEHHHPQQQSYHQQSSYHHQQQHQQQQQKYSSYQRPFGPPGSGCYNGHPSSHMVHQMGPPSSQLQGYYSHPGHQPVDEEPPVPGL